MKFHDDNGSFPMVNRRALLKSGMIAMGTGMICAMTKPAMATMRMPTLSSYSVSFRNAHTGESFNGVYRVGNKYLPTAFDQINTVLRDFRTGDVYPMDPHTLDIVYMLQQKVGGRRFEVISGYRSPKTNAMLHEASAHSGVAVNSLHMVGKAMDLHLPEYSLSHLRDLAMNLQAGGVGYYPASDFVHVDSGKVRHW